MSRDIPDVLTIAVLGVQYFIVRHGDNPLPDEVTIQWIVSPHPYKGNAQLSWLDCTEIHYPRKTGKKIVNESLIKRPKRKRSSWPHK